MREERSLRVFAIRVLREIFGAKMDGVTGEWRKIRNEELHVLYSSSIIEWVITSRRRWAGHVGRMGEKNLQGFGGENVGKGTTGETQA
jgi:hypothetical protein